MEVGQASSHASITATLPACRPNGDRDPHDLDAIHGPNRVHHDPLKGRRGAVLGVEPVQRTTTPDEADDGLVRRARRLKANAWRSVGPPGT